MMRRLLQQAIAIGYCFVTAEALLYTMSRIAFPLPEPIIEWSYGMMAPYQGDTSWNADFVYEGQLPDGTWHPIDIDAYMPYGFGERNVRKFLRVYSSGDDMQRRMFVRLASMVLDREREHGRPYKAVRVRYEQWPRSPAGYEFLHLPLFTTGQPITQVQ